MAPPPISSDATPAARRQIRAATRHLLRALGHPLGRRALLHKLRNLTKKNQEPRTRN